MLCGAGQGKTLCESTMNASEDGRGSLDGESCLNDSACSIGLS